MLFYAWRMLTSVSQKEQLSYLTICSAILVQMSKHIGKAPACIFDANSDPILMKFNRPI